MTAPTILLQRSDGPRAGWGALLVGALVAALAVTVAVMQHRITAAQRAVARAVLTASNLAAQRDTTRELAATNRAVVGATGDSLRVFERRVVQATQRGDALDAALHSERVARYNLDTVVDSLRRSLSAVAVEDTARRTRFAEFNLHQTPYTVAAHVEVPVPPDSATLTLRILLDSVPIEARVSCSPADATGIRTASLTTTAPRWASVRFGNLEQSPDVCASPALATRERRRAVRFSPLLLGAGRSFAALGAGSWSLFLGFGFAL